MKTTKLHGKHGEFCLDQSVAILLTSIDKVFLVFAGVEGGSAPRVSSVREAVRARGATDQPPQSRAQVQVAVRSQEIQASFFTSTSRRLPLSF